MRYLNNHISVYNLNDPHNFEFRELLSWSVVNFKVGAFSEECIEMVEVLTGERVVHKIHSQYTPILFVTICFKYNLPLLRWIWVHHNTFSNEIAGHVCTKELSSQFLKENCKLDFISVMYHKATRLLLLQCCHCMPKFVHRFHVFHPHSLRPFNLWS